MKYKSIIKADYFRYNGSIDTYTKVFLILLRKAQYGGKGFIHFLWRILFRIHRLKRGIEIDANVRIGPGLFIAHPFNITINDKVVIGKNCNLHKGVLIGQENRGKRKGTPQIGDNVWVGINACIVGSVTIGNDVLIAPNSYVNCNIPDHSIVFGNPCRIVHRENATYGYINNCIDSVKGNLI